MTSPTDALTIVDHDRVRERFGRTVSSSAARLLGRDATDDEWLSARRWRIGGSELSAVVPGVRNPHTSPFALWWAKSLGWTLDDTMPLRIGRKLEPVIADLFAEEHPDLIVCEPNGRLWTGTGARWMCVTPDYLAVAGADCLCTVGPWAGGERTANCELCGGTGTRPVIEPVECKSDEGGPGWGKPGTGQVPEHHELQVMAQCSVFGARRGHLVRLAGKSFRSYVIDFDPAGERWLSALAAGRAFWASLRDSEPPDVDGHEATERALQVLNPAVDDRTQYVSAGLRAEYEDARDARRAAVVRETAAKNALRAAMGDAARAAVSGEDAFVERRVYKNPGYTVGPYTVDGLYPKG